MKLKHRIPILGLFLILLLMNGCGTFSGEVELSAQDQANTSVAQTLEVMHSVETIVAMTIAAEKAEVATPTSTEVLPTDTPVAVPEEPEAPTATMSLPC